MALGEDLVKRLETRAREEATTVFVLLLSAYAVLLSRWSGSEDLVLGVPVAGRDHRRRRA